MKTSQYPAGINRLKLKMVIIFLVMFFSQIVYAQNPICVTVEGTAFMDDVTKEQARAQALENARKKAVYATLANHITCDTLEVSLEIEGNIDGSIPYGEITQETIIEEGEISARRMDGTASSQAYKVKIKACCKAQKKRRSDFRIIASLDENKRAFRPGDTLKINIQSSQDCSVYIFNLLRRDSRSSDDKVLRWFPNKHDNDNIIKADQSFQFPKSDKVKIRLSLPEGTDDMTDYIYILALKAPLNTHKSKIIEGLKDEYHGNFSSLKDLITEIVNIPFSERAECLLKYRIVNR